MWPKVIIFTFLVLILYNLGAGLYYMIVDKGRTKRMKSSSADPGFLLILGIWTGMISPHGVGG